MKKRIYKLLPKNIKRIISWGYLQFLNLFRLRSKDKQSNLEIQKFGKFDIAYRKDTSDEQVIMHSFDNDIFLAGVPEYQPSNDHIIIDIGAHIGTFSILLASLIGNGKVFSIEACRDSFNFLKINTKLNGLNNISFHHLALSDSEGSCTLYYDTGNWGHSTVKKLSNYSEIVNSSSLSNFLSNNHITKCDFLKLNCEGSEFPIILSTPPEILKCIDTILVLYHCDLWLKNTEKDLIKHLEHSNFTCIIRNQSKMRGWIIAKNQKLSLNS